MNFQEAQVQVKRLQSTPTPQELLQLYSLYKQATSGDAAGKRPGMLDMKGRAKFDAWGERKGMSRDEAESAYVGLVEQLQAKYGG